MPRTVKISLIVNDTQYQVELQTLLDELINNTSILPIIQAAVEFELKKKDIAKKEKSKKSPKNKET